LKIPKGQPEAARRRRRQNNGVQNTAQITKDRPT